MSAVEDPRGSAREANFPSWSTVLAKFWSNNRLAHPPLRLASPLGNPRSATGQCGKVISNLPHHLLVSTDDVLILLRIPVHYKPRTDLI